MIRPLLAALLPLALTSPAGAAGLLRVPQDYVRIADALAGATAGDTVRVAAGAFSAVANGEAFPLALTQPGVVLEGAGAGLSILDAAQSSSVVRCAATGVRVTGFTITAGRDTLGAGVRVESGNAQIDHCLLVDNAAVLKGSGIYAAPGTTPWIHHNVVWRSVDAATGSPGDPHGIQLTGANALVEYNTVGRGDSNSLIIEAGAEPVVQGNIFFENGSVSLHRGRGICALGGPGSVIRNNVFYGNVLAAILVVQGGALDITAQQANNLSVTDGIYDNLDASPMFVDADAVDVRLTAGSPAIDTGFAQSPLDPDGTRADAGAFYFSQAPVTGVGDLPGVGLALAAAPNPFRGRTLLAFELARAGRVRLSIIDARGRLVHSLVEGERSAGRHVVAWEGAAAAGVYFVRLEADGRVVSSTIVRVD